MKSAKKTIFILLSIALILSVLVPTLSAQAEPDPSYQPALSAEEAISGDAQQDALPGTEGNAVWSSIEGAIEGIQVLYAPIAHGGENPCAVESMFDGDPETYYESEWGVDATYLPSGYILLDLGEEYPDVSQVVYAPRGDMTNGHIGQHIVYTSTEDLSEVTLTGTQEELDQYFTVAGKGEWNTESFELQTATFTARAARYIAIQAFETGGNGETLTCAELAVITNEYTIDMNAYEEAVQLMETFLTDCEDDDIKTQGETALADAADVENYTQEAIDGKTENLMQELAEYAIIIASKPAVPVISVESSEPVTSEPVASEPEVASSDIQPGEASANEPNGAVGANIPVAANGVQANDLEGQPLTITPDANSKTVQVTGDLSDEVSDPYVSLVIFSPSFGGQLTAAWDDPAFVVGLRQVNLDNGVIDITVPLGAAHTLATGDYYLFINGATFENTFTFFELEVEGVTVTPATLSLMVGKTSALSASVTPIGVDQAVTWTSENPEIATVDANGVVTAVAEGEATIRATSVADDTISGTSTVTVTPFVDFLTVVPDAAARTLHIYGDLTGVAESPVSIVVLTPEYNGVFDQIWANPAYVQGIDQQALDNGYLDVTINISEEHAFLDGEYYLYINGTTILRRFEFTVEPQHVNLIVTPNTADKSVHIYGDLSSAIQGNTVSLIAMDPQFGGNMNDLWNNKSFVVGINQVPLSNGVIDYTLYLPEDYELSTEEYFLFINGEAVSAKFQFEFDDPDSITITPSSLNLTQNETANVTATVSPATAIQSVVWSSGNDSIATVNNGVVTAVAAGTTTITATSTVDGSVKASITVTVKNPVSAVTLTFTPVYWNKTVRVQGDFSSWDVDEISLVIVDPTYVAGSGILGNPAIVAALDQVDLNADGTLDVTVTLASVMEGDYTCFINGNDASGTFAFVIPPEPTAVTVTPATKTLFVGETVDLTAKVSPDDAIQTVNWTSSDDSIASVAMTNGVVTAKKAGTVTITATSTEDGSIKGTATITVRNTIPDITLTFTPVYYNKTVRIQGDLSALETDEVSLVIVDPTYVAGSGILGNPAIVAALDQVKLKADGTLDVTATLASVMEGDYTCFINGNDVSGTFAFEIPIAPTDITITPDTLTMTKGDTQTLNVSVEPSNADTSMTWSSSDESVAIVEEINGVVTVTAVGEGTATITATSKVNPSVTATCAVTVEEVQPIVLTFTPNYDDKTVLITGDLSSWNRDTVSLIIMDPTFAGSTSDLWNDSAKVVGIEQVTLANGQLSILVPLASIMEGDYTAFVNGESATGQFAFEFPEKPTKITIDPATLELDIDGIATLSVTVEPVGADDSVIWTSSDSTIAEVSSTGVVTAKATGTVTITATSTRDDTVFGICTVTVIDSQQVVLTFTPDYATKTVRIQGDLSSWNMTEVSLVIVDPTFTGTVEDIWDSAAKVVGLNQVVLTNGILDITVPLASIMEGDYTAFVNGASATGQFAFEIPVPTKVTINPSTLELDINGTATLSVTVEPVGADSSVTWTSSDTSVATVDATGNVTAVAEGTATITATSTLDSSVTGICTVTVKPEPTPVVLTFTPDYDTKTVRIQGDLSSWNVDEVSLVIVDPTFTGTVDDIWDSEAVIVALDQVRLTADGKLDITVTLASIMEGDYTAFVNGASATGQFAFTFPTVVAPTEITINPPTLELDINGTATLSVTVEPVGADSSVTWASSDTSVATVDATGKVTAVGEGTATITATSTVDPLVTGSCAVTVKTTPIPTPLLTFTTNTADGTVRIQGDLTSLNTSPVSIILMAPDFDGDMSNLWMNKSFVVGIEQEDLVNGQLDITIPLAEVIVEEEYYCFINGGAASGRFVFEDEEILPTDLKLVPETMELKVGENGKPLAVVFEPFGTTNKNVTWTVSNTAVAEISYMNGSYTVIPKTAGETIITATSVANPALKATCTVTVIQPVTSIILPTSTTLWLNGKDNETLDAVVKPDNASNQDLIWTSSDSSIVTVDENGHITAVGGKGEATITATSKSDPSISATCTVTVKQAVTSITLNKAATTLWLDGETGTDVETLIATILPADADNKNVIWTSSADSIVTVDANGKITAVKEGTVIITATSENMMTLKATCEVTVKRVGPVEPVKPTGITLNKNETTLTLDSAEDTETLTATITPDGATGTVIWSSDNNSAVTVSNGVITARGVGTATITARIQGTEISATCTVTVKAMPTPIVLTFTPDYAKKTVTIEGDLSSWNVDEVSLVIVDPTFTGTVDDIWDSAALVVALDQVKLTADGKLSIEVPLASIMQGDYTAFVNGASATGQFAFEIPPVPTKITITPATLELDIDDTATPSVTVEPVGADSSVTWSSSDPSVATVDENGKVTAVGEGTATITATSKSDPSVSTTCTVTVKPPVTPAIELNKDTTTLTLGGVDEETLIATITPVGTSGTVIWTSGDNSVVTVFGGYIRARGVGTATITAKIAGTDISATCTVTVEQAATGVILNKTTASIKEGETDTLVATVLPATATDKGVSWTSSNSSIASVDANGKVTAVKAGTATITVTTKDGGYTASCTVTVTKETTISVTKITVAPTSKLVDEGKTVQLTATVTPTNATNKKVTWSSSNTSVATVNANGLVTAKSKGTAVITATTTDGTNLKASSTITVVRRVTSVKITGAPTNMLNGKTAQLKAVITPSTASNTKVTWTTSDKSVLTVDSNGKVTAKGPGTATIKATVDGKSASVKITVNVYVSMKMYKRTAVNNGVKTTIDDKNAYPFKISGRTMLPIRFVAEKMGGKVTYTSDTAPIIVTFMDIRVELKLGSKTMKVTQGGKTRTVALDVAAQKRDGRTYLPIRAVSEALGFSVYYETGTEYIVVNYPKMGPALRNERLKEAKSIIK